MKHIKIDVIANEHQQEELIALLDDYPVAGFEQTDEKLIAYFSEENFVKDEVVRVLEGYTYQVSDVEEKNWNEEWERNFKPVVVEDFVAVRAHFHEPINDVKHEIVITPKMSFGTGHHATTYMMMQQMRDMDFVNKRVFDFGTGTGILAILAEKLGADKVVAIDVDDCHKIEVSLSSQLPKEQFDIILANINRNVILDYLPQLKNTLEPNATILFSGLLAADEEAIKDVADKNGLMFVQRKERQGWISMLYRNSN
jgi:ribosomal protein L11 methyltransferase